MRKIVEMYLKVSLVLFPLSFLPLMTDMYGMGKTWWWLALAVIGLVLWTINLLAEKKHEVKVDGVLWILGGLAVWSLISWLRMPIGLKERTLWEPTGLATIVGLLIWYFLMLQAQLSKEEWVKWLKITGVIAAAGALIMFLMPDNKLPIVWPKDNPLLIVNKSWSIVGSLFSELALLGYLLINGIKDLAERVKKNQAYMVQAATTAFMTLGAGLDLYRVSKLGGGILDLNSAWVIATESFKNNPLWGAGSGNFVEAFYLYRPSSFNLTSVWSSVFNVSSMLSLQLWTELGVVGLILTVLLASSVIKNKAKDFNYLVSLIVLAVALLLPFSYVVMMLLVIALVVVSKPKTVKLLLTAGEQQVNTMPYIVAVVSVVVSGLGLFKLGAKAVAESLYRNSMVAAAKNDGTKTYETQRNLVAMAANSADYRKMYSQTNLAIALNLLSNKDISDDDKQKASVLLQQSVREAKAAVALDNYNTSYWTNLALIYKQMIGVVDGSADYAAQAYQQAILLDPANALLKLDYGGLLFGAERYEEADRVFEQAVTNKADLANGWYNWAYTAKKLNKIDLAVQRLAQAVALVPATSGDYDKASKELESWKKEYDEAVKKYQEAQKAAAQSQEKQPETLKTPEPLPTKGNGEKVTLPASEIEPPKVVSPTQAPSAPTVVPTVNP